MDRLPGEDVDAFLSRVQIAEESKPDWSATKARIESSGAVGLAKGLSPTPPMNEVNSNLGEQWAQGMVARSHSESPAPAPQPETPDAELGPELAAIKAATLAKMARGENVNGEIPPPTVEQIGEWREIGGQVERCMQAEWGTNYDENLAAAREAAASIPNLPEVFESLGLHKDAQLQAEAMRLLAQIGRKGR